MKELDSTDSNEEDDEDDDEIKENLCTSEQPYPLYDKSIRHIGGLSYGSLRLYKNYFMETGIIKVPEKFIGNEILMKNFTDFLSNNE